MKYFIPLLFNYRTLAKMLLFLIPILILASVYWPEPPAEIVFSALRWPAEISVTNQQDKEYILDALSYMNKLRQPGPPKQLALYKMKVTRGAEQHEYLISEAGEYFTPDGTAVLPSYRLRELVKEYTQRLERQSSFGQLLSWEEARKIFSRYSRAALEDVDTGLRFEVQRRAGSYHADVQPLTAQDTEIMEEIYNGKWSWRRRAVIVEVNSTRIAASMSGYPHGAGAIRKNNFNGHFCIHFKDSTTHQNPRKTDLAHQIMVWKAAGRLPEMLRYCSPEQVAEIFLTALDQKAPDIAVQTLVADPQINTESCQHSIEKILNLTYSIKAFDDRANSLKVSISVDYADGPKNVKKELELRMVNSLGFWWKIDPRSAEKIFNF
ncbi:MAG: hypothetical protein H0Z40_07570 [Desulfotomaculum sp.]|nr:hypothetical protein [Desulfotomaculum sp.]